MKVLFLVPQRYSLFNAFRNVFLSRGCEVHAIDFFQHVKKWEKSLNVQIFRLPDKARVEWEKYYFGRINAFYTETYKRIQPDLVFVYNNEMLLPETLDFFKKKSKVAFFMGDHPFYTPTNRYYLALLTRADAIFAPDTFWIEQLSKMGVKNAHFLHSGIPEDQYFQQELPSGEYEALKSEVLYVGVNYTDSWGYKKAQFLNSFTAFDLRIHGNKHWKRWFPFFPELKRFFHEREGYYPVEQMNKMYNAAKIIPIDGNPGLLRGVHLRMFEALGAGALPMLEWQEDLTLMFGKGVDLPAVRSYDEIPEMAAYYLGNEKERLATVERMRQIAREKFSVEKIADIIFDAIK